MYLIIGGDGLIGEALSRDFSSRGIQYHASTRDSEKVSNNNPYIDLGNCRNYQPDDNYSSAIICAAMSKHHDCDKYPNETYRVNCSGVINIVRKLNANGTHVVFLSTSQVFDGEKKYRSPKDLKSPVSEYGRQKSYVEDVILSLGNTSVLRLSKVVYKSFPLFVDLKNKLINGKVINAYKDYYFAPVDLDKVVKKIVNIIDNNMHGIYHVPSGNDVTYYNYALSIAHSLKVSPNYVNGVNSEFDGIRSKFNSLKE